MNARKLGVIGLALFSLVGASCSSQKDNSTSSDKSKNGVDLQVCLASECPSLDPALNTTVDGATYDVHLFAGLYRYRDPDGDGLANLEPDLLAENGETKTTNAKGETVYTFRLRSGIKFSDGSPITASDFVYSWNRAAGGQLAAEYAYMFDVIGNSAKVEADTKGTEKLDVTAVDDSTLQVVLPVDVPYFHELLAFPAYMVVKQAAVEAVSERGAWCKDTANFVTSGSYTVSRWDRNSELYMVKNSNYWDASSVTLNSIGFAFSDNTANMEANYENGSYALIDDFPIDDISKWSGKEDYHINGQLGTYYMVMNVNSTKFNAKADTEEKRAKVRHALTLLINRNYIVDSVAQGGQEPANSFVPTGLTDSDGKTEFVNKNGVNGDGKGYYSVAAKDYTANVAEAVSLLKEVGYTYDESTKKFTDFPKDVGYLYNTSDAHAAIAQAIQANFANVGISITLKNEEWSTFITDRQNGDYDLARNGWLADYNDPITFLDMWTSTSGNNDAQFGKGTHATYAGYSVDVNGDGTVADNEKNLTWAQSYDVLIDNIKKETDTTKRFAMMHTAENQLFQTWALSPIYFYTDLYLANPSMKGFFHSPLGYKFFMNATLD